MPLPDAFRAEPMLTDRHRDELKKRGISAEFAIKNGVFTAADNELRRLSFDAEGMRHVMDVLRYIARSVGCAVCVVHHHRKTGARETKYEGGDDMLGSIVIQAKIDAGLSLYIYKRADETNRHKMVFTKLRHSVQQKPLEILR